MIELNTRTVTLTVRRSRRDRYGDKQASSEHASPGWIVTPSSGESTRDTGHDNDQTVTGHTAYGPPGVDIEATDEVITPDGVRWQLTRPPIRHVDPFPQGPDLDATVLYLQHVAG